MQACYVSVMFVSCPAARFHATSLTMCIYVYAGYAICMRQRGHFQAARHFHALHPCGSAALSRTICMRQRGHFHSFTLKAARRHLGMSATTVCRTVRAFEFVRVCSSLLEFAFEFVLSWAVRVLRNRVNRVSRCASRCVSRCASRCVNFSQPHALTRPRARWRWWRWVFSVHLSLVARWRRVGEVVTICRVRAMARWLPCPRGPSSCVAVFSARFSWRQCVRQRPKGPVPLELIN